MQKKFKPAWNICKITFKTRRGIFQASDFISRGYPIHFLVELLKNEKSCI